MNLSELAGQICKVLLPINEEVFFGNPDSNVAICTLSSMNLLREISNSHLMQKVALAGRLLSENKGIDLLVKYINKHPNLDTIIICGNDAAGHKAGHALSCLHKFGVDKDNRIINCVSSNPFLSISDLEIRQFQKQITLIEKIGQTNLEKIRSLV